MPPTVITCPQCGKSYSLGESVPPTFACRACGVVMDLSGFATAPPPPPAPPITPCRSCGAVPAAGAGFCEACGKPLTAEAKRAGPAGDPIARKLANRELGQADRAISTVRMVFIIGAVLYGLATLGLMALPRDFAFKGILVLLAGGTASLMVAGAICVRRNPFAWSLVLACFSTLGVVLGLLGGGLPWIQGIIMFLAWGAVGKATRMRALIARHPELRIARRLRGESSGGSGRPARRLRPERGARRGT